MSTLEPVIEAVLFLMLLAGIVVLSTSMLLQLFKPMFSRTPTMHNANLRREQQQNTPPPCPDCSGESGFTIGEVTYIPIEEFNGECLGCDDDGDDD